MTTGSGDNFHELRWQSPVVTQFVHRDSVNMAVRTDLPSLAWLSRESQKKDRGAWELVLCVGKDRLVFDVTDFANGGCHY